jgi:TldD protein
MEFEALARRALDTATVCGAQYSDIRFEDVHSERIEARNGVVASLADGRGSGYGIRALVDGAWGFAASSDLTDAGIDRTAARAVAIARASASIARERFGAPPQHVYVDRYATPLVRDPRDVPLGQRVALLLEAEKLAHAGGQIAVARAWLDLWRTQKYFYSTSGSAIEQTIVQTGTGVQAMAVGDGDVQTRTYPGDVGLYKSGGWEIVEEAALVQNAQRIGEEAIALLTAPQCPSGVFDIVLGGSQVSLQIHESC